MLKRTPNFDIQVLAGLIFPFLSGNKVHRPAMCMSYAAGVLPFCPYGLISKNAGSYFSLFFIRLSLLGKCTNPIPIVCNKGFPSSLGQTKIISLWQPQGYFSHFSCYSRATESTPSILITAFPMTSSLSWAVDSHTHGWYGVAASLFR